MKDVFPKLEFALIIAIFVLPPLVFQFSMPKVEVINADFGLQTFVLALVALFVYWQHRNVHLIRFQSKWTLFRILVLSGESFKLFGFICIISVALEFLGNLTGISSSISKVILPETFNGWSIFIAGVICSAFSEEVIYRMYLPESMNHFIVGHPRIPVILPEIIALLLFALGHIYLGIFGFLNALFCGIVLRRCILKTHSIWFTFIPHAIYNFLVFIVMAKLGV